MDRTFENIFKSAEKLIFDDEKQIKIPKIIRRQKNKNKTYG